MDFCERAAGGRRRVKKENRVLRIVALGLMSKLMLGYAQYIPYIASSPSPSPSPSLSARVKSKFGAPSAFQPHRYQHQGSKALNQSRQRCSPALASTIHFQTSGLVSNISVPG